MSACQWHPWRMAATCWQTMDLVQKGICCLSTFLGCRWVHSEPHPPSKELKETLYNAAFHDGAHGLHASTGMAIVTTGDSSIACIQHHETTCHALPGSRWL